ncbi:ribosome maturation factor RimM [Sneathiella sp.]|jgi:16S rRNA processing protein RimM|uniref:ribosome maturation factor RimM n=1 Tax=Sneathiella sp. TaxID=1964365 RepID=UPI0039E702A9
MPDDKDRLLLGVIAGPRGIRGEMKVKTFTENPEDIAAYGQLESKDGKVKYKLSLQGFSKAIPVVRIKGVTTRNEAEALKGTELYVTRDKLPKTDGDDEFYHADLIGLDAVLEDGSKFGSIFRVFEFGAGDMLEIIPEGKSAKAAILVPFTLEMVPAVDLEKGHVVLSLSDDFFDVPEKEVSSEKKEDTE